MTESAESAPSLVGDIGATNARFALVYPGGAPTRTHILLCEDYPTIEDAIAEYLAEEAPPAGIAEAALAVASLVGGDRVTLTNHPWTFSIEAVRQRFAWKRLQVVNDFVANAIAVPRLREEDWQAVGGGTAVSGAPIGIIGPGSGLGMSALVFCGGHYTPVESEGGHVTMAAADAREAAVLDLLRRRFDHVSAERLLSGPGLVQLYNALCELDAAPAAALTAAQITSPEYGQQDPRARAATEMFCAMLGTIAGNLALTIGARGGIYIAGGIVARLGPAFARSAFRDRFEAKGRFRDYLAGIPTRVIVHPFPALLGAADLLARP